MTASKNLKVGLQWYITTTSLVNTDFIIGRLWVWESGDQFEIDALG